MAFTFTYNGWRRESGLAAQRSMLILHIEEIENLIAGYETQKSLDQMGQKNLAALQEMLKRREENLLTLDNDIAGDAGDDNPFFSTRPVQ